jgi:hypothetical protein
MYRDEKPTNRVVLERIEPAWAHCEVCHSQMAIWIHKDASGKGDDGYFCEVHKPEDKGIVA